MNVIFSCVHGSRLYGVENENSDWDHKAVFIKSLDDIILGRGEDNVRIKLENEEWEYIEFRKFIRDLISGQTYAIEMLFAEGEGNDLWQEVVNNRHRAISQNMKPFVGYCMSQAKKYGKKGDNYKKLSELLTLLRSVHPNTKLGDLETSFKIVKQPLRGQEKDALLFEVMDKRYDLCKPVKSIIPSVEGIQKRYGARSKRASEGVNWKAVSHAYRVAYQLEAILTTGKIEYPLSQREQIKAVKEGRYEGDVDTEIPALIERVVNMESNLPESADVEFWENLVVEAYKCTYN